MLSTESALASQFVVDRYIRDARSDWQLPAANAEDAAGNTSANPAFSYAYYGATETRDNPCTTTAEAFKQAGFMKIKTEADPDGAGAQVSRKSETLYDNAGRAVATRK